VWLHSNFNSAPDEGGGQIRAAAVLPPETSHATPCGVQEAGRVPAPVYMSSRTENLLLLPKRSVKYRNISVGLPYNNCQIRVRKKKILKIKRQHNNNKQRPPYRALFEAMYIFDEVSRISERTMPFNSHFKADISPYTDFVNMPKKIRLHAHVHNSMYRRPTQCANCCIMYKLQQS
jgi:hypothetical protein